MAAAIAVLVAVVFAPDPDPDSRSRIELHDFGHVPAFGLVALAILVLVPVRLEATTWRRAARPAVALAGAALLGVLVEIAQSRFPGGRTGLRDVAADVAGAAAAVLAEEAIRTAVGRTRRGLLLASAGALVAAFLAPTAMALVEEARARRSFPVLADFTSSAQLGRFEGSANSRLSLERSVLPDGRIAPALRLHLDPGRYPGMVLRHFPRDWRGWRGVAVTVVNPSADPFPLHVRIDDIGHGATYEDRYNDLVSVPPGRSVIEIPLSAVESAPRGRRMNLAAVRFVVLFAVDLREPRDLLFEDIRLVR